MVPPAGRVWVPKWVPTCSDSQTSPDSPEPERLQVRELLRPVTREPESCRFRLTSEGSLVRSQLRPPAQISRLKIISSRIVASVCNSSATPRSYAACTTRLGEDAAMVFCGGLAKDRPSRLDHGHDPQWRHLGAGEDACRRDPPAPRRRAASGRGRRQPPLARLSPAALPAIGRTPTKRLVTMADWSAPPNSSPVTLASTATT